MRRPALKLELQRLRDEDALGFKPEEYITSETFKQRLALERAKSVRDLDIYSAKSQQALTTFFQQLALVFKTKPITYS